MRRFAPVLAALLMAAAAASAPASAATLGAPSSAAITPASSHPAPGALSSAEKQSVLLDVIERFVPHAETYWRASDLREPRTGWYQANGPGVTQPRGAGNIALAYATLLTSRPDQERFGGVAREILLDRTIQSIRHEALTSTQSGAGYNRWGGGTWQASLETYGWAFAARLLWTHLDDETRALVRRVVTAEADILITKPIASGEWGDTGAEDSGWNAPTPALAAVMFPDDPHRAQWEETAKRLALNASSSGPDRDSDRLVDGKPLREWMVSTNLHPDLTMENHGFFNPIYQQVTHANIGEGAVIYAQAGHPLPEAFAFRTEEIWERILGPLTTDDGDLVATAGQDWTSKDYQHLLYLSILAARFDRADASVAESRALAFVARRQAGHDDGSILGQPQLGYESMLIKRMTQAWWNHELFGPEPAPTAAEYERARDRTSGVRRYADINVIQARQRDAFVSMSWDDARPMGLIVPAATGHLDDPLFSYYAPQSLVGAPAGAVGPTACDCREDRFSTAGTIGARRFSMSAFPDGVTLLLDRGQGATFRFALERIEGLTGPRPIQSEGDRWVNAADRLGMIVAGGGGIATRQVNTPNPHTIVEGSSDTGTGNRGAVLLPLASSETTDRLAEHVHQPPVPDGWSALEARAPDGTSRLAFARWAGPEEATLELTDARGAPVTSMAARIEGRMARAAARAEAPSSHAEIVRFFVDAGDPVEARLVDEGHALVRNPGTGPARITVTYVAEDGRELTAERVLEAGEEMTARVLDGRLTLAGPEYEPLLKARDRMAGLADQIADWRADGTLSAGQAVALRTIVELARREIADALEAAGKSRPDTARAAAAVVAARRFVALLPEGADSGVPISTSYRRIDRHTRGSDRRDPLAAGSAEIADPGDWTQRGALDSELVGVDERSDPWHLPPEVAERVGADRAAVIALLDAAVRDGLSLRLRLEALTDARPSETLQVRATLLNRGQSTATQGELRLQLPAGWTADPAPAGGPLRPGETRLIDVAIHVPDDAPPGDRVTLHATYDHRQGTAAAELPVTVEPLIELEALTPRLLLAAGGWNRADARIVSHASRELDVDLTAEPPPGVTVEPARHELRLSPEQPVEASFELRGTAATGGGDLRITAGAAAASVRLEYSDNLALNPFGARWPAAFADDAQPQFPPALANDGKPDTFWVSAGTAAGQGPAPDRPIAVGVDFGAPLQIQEVRMTPRVGFGPKAYRIQVSDQNDDWRTVAEVPDVPNAAHTARFAPTTARKLRLLITDSWDRIRPPRNVQVAELAVL